MVLFSWETEDTEAPPPGFSLSCRGEGVPVVSKPKIPSKMGAGFSKAPLFGKISTMNDQKTVSLGARLKNAREAKGITLEDVSRQTRISKGMLQSLEEDRYELLPGGFFNRGLIRSYSAFLGLPGEEELKLYERLHPKEERKREASEPIEFSKEGFFVLHRRGLLWTAGIVAFLVFVVWLFLPVGDFTPKPVQQQPEVRLEQTPPPVQAPSPTPTAEDAQPQEASAETPLPVEEPKSLTLKLTFNGDCWIQMRKSGELTEEGLFKKGETIDAEGEAFQIRIGNPGVIAITINGQEGRFPWNPAQPYTLELNMENFKEFLPR